jgi:hypothetical protein
MSGRLDLRQRGVAPGRTPDHADVIAGDLIKGMAGGDYLGAARYSEMLEEDLEDT